MPQAMIVSTILHSAELIEMRIVCIAPKRGCDGRELWVSSIKTLNVCNGEALLDGCARRFRMLDIDEEEQVFVCLWVASKVEGSAGTIDYGRVIILEKMCEVGPCLLA